MHKGFLHPVKTLMTLAFSLLLMPVSAQINQDTFLPKGFAPGEKEAMPAYLNLPYFKEKSFTQPPNNLFLRNTGEWEEVQALVITWTSYLSVHREIIKAVQNETPIVIVCNDSNSVKNNLITNNIPLTNLTFLVAPYNTVWIRDYMANTVYTNEVDSLILVDWIYNRPRASDDTLPRAIAKHFNIPLYETRLAPFNLVNTGGNYMSDGLGMGFASNLVLMENQKSNAEINEIMYDFMGLSEYVKMPILPYDGIHHIDMHMKLMDEETLLMGEYPAGVADGPQIEANLQYVLSNFKTFYGRDYKVVRIPMPPQTNGLYPPNGNYLTYANNSIINKTVIVPTYYAKYDTTALRIIREAMPGYNVVGINSNSTISAGGSLHCITHTVGVEDPLFISHKAVRDTIMAGNSIPIEAIIKHRSGIATATAYYRTSPSQAFQPINLTFSGNRFEGTIPAQSGGVTVEYYINAESNTGKKQSKPMPAPAAFYSFYVEASTTGIEKNDLKISFAPAFPNPSKGITCIPVYAADNAQGSLKLLDLTGREVEVVFEGSFTKGESKLFVNTANIPAGAYLLVLQQGDVRRVQKLMVK
jgi:agmatine deiminase